MSAHLKITVSACANFGRGFWRARAQTAVLAVIGFFLLMVAVEIGSSTDAAASGECCPAGYSLSVDTCITVVNGVIAQVPPIPCPGGPIGFRSMVPAPVMVTPFLGLSPDNYTNPFNNISTPIFGLGQGGSHLGMYVSPSGADGAAGYGDGFGISGKSIGISDTSGAFAGASTPAFHGSGGGGGIYGYVDLTPQLQAVGSFDFKNLSADYSGAGSTRTNAYTFEGDLIYQWAGSYLRGIVRYQYAPTAFFDAATAGSGNYNTNAFDGDISGGHTFVLIDPRAAGNRTLLTKAPPATAVVKDGLLLELSGHGGYVTGITDSFTESTGFAWGEGHIHYGDIGVLAKLEGVVPANGLVWVPYIGGSVDQFVGFSQTLGIPAQAGAVADTLTFSQATTVLGAQAGIETQLGSGWQIGAKVFATASSDFNIVGGTGYVNVKF